MKNVYVLRDGKYPINAVQVTEIDAQVVKAYPLGGGMLGKMPREQFDKLYRSFDSKIDSMEWTAGAFGIDDYFGDEGVAGFSTGLLWNGFEQPVFEKPSMEILASTFGDMVFDELNDQYVIQTHHEDEPYFYSKGFDIEVDGKIKHVYPAIDGWTWHKENAE